MPNLFSYCLPREAVNSLRTVTISDTSFVSLIAPHMSRAQKNKKQNKSTMFKYWAWAIQCISMSRQLKRKLNC